MYPLGHVGIALILSSLFFVPAAAMVAGVLLPDIFDKGLALLGVLECGRSAGHNIFFAMGANDKELIRLKPQTLKYFRFFDAGHVVM